MPWQNMVLTHASTSLFCRLCFSLPLPIYTACFKIGMAEMLLTSLNSLHIYYGSHRPILCNQSYSRQNVCRTYRHSLLNSLCLFTSYYLFYLLTAITLYSAGRGSVRHPTCFICLWPPHSSSLKQHIPEQMAYKYMAFCSSFFCSYWPPLPQVHKTLRGAFRRCLLSITITALSTSPTATTGRWPSSRGPLPVALFHVQAHADAARRAQHSFFASGTILVTPLPRHRLLTDNCRCSHIATTQTYAVTRHATACCTAAGLL